MGRFASNECVTREAHAYEPREQDAVIIRVGVHDISTFPRTHCHFTVVGSVSKEKNTGQALRVYSLTTGQTRV